MPPVGWLLCRVRWTGRRRGRWRWSKPLFQRIQYLKQRIMWDKQELYGFFSCLSKGWRTSWCSRLKGTKPVSSRGLLCRRSSTELLWGLLGCEWMRNAISYYVSNKATWKPRDCRIGTFFPRVHSKRSDWIYTSLAFLDPGNLILTHRHPFEDHVICAKRIAIHVLWKRPSMWYFDVPFNFNPFSTKIRNIKLNFIDQRNIPMEAAKFDIRVFYEDKEDAVLVSKDEKG